MYNYSTCPTTEYHISVLSSKFLIALVDYVRGWNPISALPLRNKIFHKTVDILRFMIYMKKKKDIQFILGLCEPLISSQKQYCFLGEMRFTEQVIESPQVHTAGGI